MSRPTADACAPYYRQYIDLVPDGEITETLQRQMEATASRLRGLDAATWDHRYAPDKWTVKQVVEHMVDTERIMSTRALCFARGERQSLPGFEQDDYVSAGHDAGRSPASLLEEWTALRAANVALFRSYSAAQLDRAGLADGKKLTPRAIAWLLAGHERHQLAVLEERYFASVG